jgi:RHS repeat-associated protein
MLPPTSAHAQGQNQNYWVTHVGCFYATVPPGQWSTFEEAAQACATIEGFIVDYCSPSGVPTAPNNLGSKCVYFGIYGGTKMIAGADLEGATAATTQYYVTTDSIPLSDCGCDPNNNDKVSDPISPANGNVSHQETDVPAQASSQQSAFDRFYNSADLGTTDLGTGWRHSFSRNIVANLQTASYQHYFNQYPRDSSLYADPGDACTAGWPQISAMSTQWADTTSSYANGVCSLSQGGNVVTTIQVRNAFQMAPTTAATAVSFDAIRDDGQDIKYTILGSTLVPATGSTFGLTQTSNGYQLIDNDDNVETYNANGQLLTVTSRAGVAETMSYDSSNRLSTVTDSFGHILTLAYNAQNQLTSVTDPNGGTVRYGYDSNARLSTVTNLDTTTRSYTYESGEFPQLLTGVVDESNTRFSTWGYDAYGRGNSSQEAGGANAASLTYNSNGSVTTTDALGAVRTFNFNIIGNQNRVTSISGSQCPTCQESASTTYDGAGFVASRTDYDGNVTCYANDPVRGLELVRVEGLAAGSGCPANLASYTPTGVQRKISTAWNATWREPATITEATRTTSFAYDGSGNALTKTVTDTTVSPNVARTWTYTYNSFGQVLTAKGPRTDVNDTTTYQYYTCTSGSQCGQVQTVTNAAGQVTTFLTYNAYGQPLTITDPNGTQTTLTYDQRQRVTSRQVGSETTQYSYYPTGLLETVTLPDGSSLTLSYDGAHRLTKIADGAGNYVSYTLDALGNRTAESAYDTSNTLSRTHSRVFNALSELYQDIGANSASTTTLGYDANGNLTSSAAPLSRNTATQYDALNRLTQITDPGTGTTIVGYDTSDNVASVTDPNTLQTTYTHNGFNDLTQQVSHATGTTTNTFDSGGNLKTSTDARGAVATYTYDQLNRVTSTAYAIGGSTDQTVSFTYDTGTNGKGHLTGASDANHSLAWSYDALGRVTGMGQTVTGVTKSVGYGYTNGDLTTLTTPSGQTITYAYSDHQITGITVNSTALLTNAAYEPFGPVRGWTWGNSTTEVRLHNTDGNQSQLSSVEASTLGYDAGYRITSVNNSTNTALSWTLGYDALDRTTSASQTGTSQGFGYDADGNRLTQTGAGTPSALWTAGASFTYNARGRMSSASAGATTNYIYNALGQLIQKSGATTTLLVYDLSGHLVGEYTGAGTLIQETVWLNDLPVATLRPNGTGISIYYVHADQLGAPRLVTRPADNVIMWRWDTDPFGTITPNQNPASQGTFVYNLRFPGQYYQAETGLNYNYFRDYDPGSGRYVESDPIGLAGESYSTYAYANEKPVSIADPSGLCPEQCKKLAKDITRLRNELKKRASDLINDPLNLPAFGPSMTVESHQVHFENVQKGLRKKLDAYRTEGCDDDDGDGGIPWDASIYATMITPSPSDWRPSGLSPSPSTLSAIAAALQSAATALETAF